MRIAITVTVIGIVWAWLALAGAALYFAVQAGHATVRMVEQQQMIDVSWKTWLSTHPGMHCDGT
jgi:hypothetical protein